ncbi:MAG: hypothetical protein FWD46_06300 [Cystobacterineae bacterium]|nr:hypothetical protein [Cystobacterineae bacterium]
MHTFHPVVLLKRLSKLGVLSVCLAAFAQAAPPKNKEVLEPYEGIENLRSKLYLYTDGNGHYLALSETVDRKPTPIFWGNGHVFFVQEVGGITTRKDKAKEDELSVFLSFDLSFWEPRTDKNTNNIVKEENGEFYMTCGKKRKTLLQPVPAEEAKTIVEKAQFYERRFMREPHLLVRNDAGTYYYVDKSSKEGEKDYQFFIGKRGQLKKAKLKNIVRDSEGEIFATPNGSLRIVVGRDEIYWVHGKQKQALVRIPVEQNINLPFVWNDLGMYANKKMDTPCDDI